MFSGSMGGFLLLSVSRGEAKGGQFREMLLRQSLPPLFICGFGFAVRVC